MSQDVDQSRGLPPATSSSTSAAATKILQELCSTSSDPSLFSFSRTKALKRDYFVSPTKDRKGKGRASIAASTLSSSSSSALIRVSTPHPPPPTEPGRSSPLGAHPSTASSSASRRDSRNNINQDTEMATAVAYPERDLLSPSSWFGISPFSTKSLQYIFGEEEGCGARKALFPQSRELYLHPSQIFSPPTNLSTGLAGDYSAATATNLADEAQRSDNNIHTPLTLPPMLTVEEIEAEVSKLVPRSSTRTGAPATAKHETSAEDVPVPSGYLPAQPPYVPQSQAMGPPPDPRYWSAHPLTASYDQLQQGQYPPPQFSTFYPPDIADSYNSHPPPPMASGRIPAPYYGPPAPGPSNYLAPLPATYPAPASAESHVYSDTSVAVHPTSSPPNTAPSVPSVGRSDSPVRPATSGGKSDGKSDDAKSDDSSKEGRSAKRTGKLPANTTALLKEWLMAHVHHPYPTEDEKKELCRETKLAMSQVSNWFINARRRILPALGTVTVSGNRKQLNHPVAPLPPSQRLNAIGARLPPTRTTAAAARQFAHPYSHYPPPMPPPGAYPPHMAPYPGYPPPAPHPGQMMHPPYPPYGHEHGYYGPPPPHSGPMHPSQGPPPPHHPQGPAPPQ